jgi:hypothetical protein
MLFVIVVELKTLNFSNKLKLGLPCGKMIPCWDLCSFLSGLQAETPIHKEFSTHCPWDFSLGIVDALHSSPSAFLLKVSLISNYIKGHGKQTTAKRIINL